MIEGWTHTSPAQQITAGPQAIRALSDLFRSLGVRRALLVTTEGRLDSDAGQAIVTQMGRGLAEVFSQVEPHVPARSVQQGAEVLRASGADGVVSFGGGSAIDTAKALAFFAEHEAGWPGAGFSDRPLLPHVAIPTTLVGAPYTSTFSMVDPNTRRSTSAGGATTTPSAVVIDLSVVAGLPVALLGPSVAVALAHGIEAAWSPAATPESRALAVAGLSRLAATAPAAIAAPEDLERRASVLTAAMLCGRARQNAGDGLQQALAQLVASRAQIPHAAAHAALLPHTVRFIADVVPSTAAEAVAWAFGAQASDPADLVAAFVASMAGIRSLSHLGVTDDDLDAVARQSAAQRGVQTSVRPAGESDIRALLADAAHP